MHDLGKIAVNAAILRNPVRESCSRRDVIRPYSASSVTMGLFSSTVQVSISC